MSVHMAEEPLPDEVMRAIATVQTAHDSRLTILPLRPLRQAIRDALRAAYEQGAYDNR